MADAIDEIDKPNKRLRELWECLHYDEDLPVTYRQMRNAVVSGELIPTKLSNTNYFSLRDGLDWVAAQRGRKRSKPGEARPRPDRRMVHVQLNLGPPHRKVLPPTRTWPRVGGSAYLERSRRP
jgi:hypothetical protein